MRTREEHLAWCKQRALKYLDDNDLANAVTSMASDLMKHEGTRFENKHVTQLGMLYVLERSEPGVRRWIEGFR